jgi:hypothetical protein
MVQNIHNLYHVLQFKSMNGIEKYTGNKRSKSPKKNQQVTSLWIENRNLTDLMK